jgi:hypothetical protein
LADDPGLGLRPRPSPTDFSHDGRILSNRWLAPADWEECPNNGMVGSGGCLGSITPGSVCTSSPSVPIVAFHYWGRSSMARCMPQRQAESLNLFGKVSLTTTPTSNWISSNSCLSMFMLNSPSCTPVICPRWVGAGFQTLPQQLECTNRSSRDCQSLEEFFSATDQCTERHTGQTSLAIGLSRSNRLQ